MSRMFLGEYNPNITEGSRVALPKKFREQIPGDEIVLSKGFDKCILAFVKADWESNVHKQIENSGESIKRTDLERYLYTSATEATVDTQGRMVLPSGLKTYAGIETKTAVIGVGDHVEIWDYDNWTKHVQRISAQLTL